MTVFDVDLTELPVLDLAQADDPAGRDEFTGRLLAATRDVGFFYLVGHGIEQARAAEIFAVARRLFALPEPDKRAVEMLLSPAFRGWTRLGGELTRGRTDWREQIDIAVDREQGRATDAEPWNVLEGRNQWPAALAADLPTVQAWIDDLSAVGQRLLRVWAIALGQPADVFESTFTNPYPLLKLVRYPANPDATHQDSGQGVGGHKDPGVLTLLLLEPGSDGLQVEHAGRWIDAPPRDGAFVVNIGEVLEVATDGLLKATEHRVLSPTGGRERLSVPFFYNPALAARFPPLSLPPELAAQATGVTQDAANVLHDTFGANVLKARLRAHPDVAARHHPDLVERFGRPTTASAY